MHEGHPPVVADGVVYGASTNGAFYAFDAAATGAERWTVPAVVGGAPAVADGLIAMLHRDGILTLDAATGQERWRAGYEPWANIAVAGGHVYVLTRGGSGDDPGTLLALDAAPGEERWSFAGTQGLEAIWRSAPAPPTRAAGTARATMAA